jgi:membrane associated rhomboid family serine protease
MQPTYPPAGEDPYYGFAGCYRHPDRLTGVRCVRCNRPICPECQRPASVGFQCPDDVRAGQASIRQPRTVVGAQVAGSGAPVATYGLIGLNVLAYVLTAVSPGGNLVSNSGSRLFGDWVLWPRMVGQNHEYYRLITSAFLHYGPIHILLNMYALYVIGPALERALGRGRYLSVYLLAALGGAVAVLLFDPVDSGTAGASGAIFGLFAAAVVLARRIGFNTTTLWITIGINFVFTFSVPGISKLGHVGGFVLGGLAALVLIGGRVNRSGPVPGRQLQAAGLATLLVLLLGAAAWRTEQIHQDLRSGQAAARVIASSTRVERAGDNYTRVITAVEDAVDNRPGPAVNASGPPYRGR